MNEEKVEKYIKEYNEIKKRTLELAEIIPAYIIKPYMNDNLRAFYTGLKHDATPEELQKVIETIHPELKEEQCQPEPQTSE